MQSLAELLDWTDAFSIVSWGALVIIMLLLTWGNIEDETHVIVALTIFASITLNTV